MKSISEAVAGALTAQEAPSNALALPMRQAPLDSTGIEKIEQKIAEVFECKMVPVYGDVAKKDSEGNYYGTEFDLIGYHHEYTQRAEVTERLREAVMRPARRDHIVYHLTRLAAHCRDTRGQQALGVVISDIAADVDGVSEWAVITACKELRAVKSPWFPATGVVIDAVKQAQKMLVGLFFPKEQTAPALQHTPAATPKGWKEIPREKWKAEHWGAYCADAAGMAAQAKATPLLDSDFWVQEAARRCNEAALAGYPPTQEAEPTTEA